MQQNIVFDISSENSSSSDEDEFIKMDQQNSSILSIRAPNLFDSDTPQEFQQIPEATQSLRKQHTVTFETLNTNEGERRQLNKWNLSEKENRNRNSFTITTEVTEKDRGNIKKNVNEINNNKLSPIHVIICINYNLEKQPYQPKRVSNVNYSSIDNFQNQSMAQKLLELDLPALISQITNKRRVNNNNNNNSFHNHNNTFYNSNPKPQMSQKQGCIVRQSFNKQGSQGDIPIVQQTRERSITMILRQPGKIVNQKQLKSNSIALRK
ncbi:unnamed protein product (macronuclear) [Paramecium tetraurelia]|uniref:Uncharacterized protein n=1 Tax=Paramecium tetraurelia TaxID=5888 RepID=A0E0K6_PARTE|nr:uncharacterized protein GSPATT00021991001 [Paramecium tetraurelia]CAK88823.1 unnamed protein product [Paramecium tetraurelia]|eukprot:XP_001456220.1 hypothetical protein (macronuclear) [Paramecium tetraurelia strain d4-2]